MKPKTPITLKEGRNKKSNLNETQKITVMSTVIETSFPVKSWNRHLNITKMTELKQALIEMERYLNSNREPGQPEHYLKNRLKFDVTMSFSQT